MYFASDELNNSLSQNLENYDQKKSQVFISPNDVQIGGEIYPVI